MANDGFQIDKRFKKTMQGKFERFNLQAGILKDKPHKEPRPVAKKKTKKQKAVSKPRPSKPSKKKKVTMKDTIRKAKAKLKRSFRTKAQKERERNQAIVRSNAARGLGTIDGMAVRLRKPTTRGTVAKIGEWMRTIHGIPYLVAPFQNYNSKEMKLLRFELFNLIRGKTKSYHKAQAMLRDVLRIPFQKRRYGRNTQATKRVKTFDRLGVDTGQVYKALQGKVRVNRNV